MNFTFHHHRPSLSSAISLLAFLSAPLLPCRAEALTILDQPRNAYNTQSQAFPDFPQFSSAGFDDFTLDTPATLTSIVAYGTEEGNATENIQVQATIWSRPDLASIPLASFSGAEIGSDLLFEPLTHTLSSGTYWLSVQISRPISGGQWFWAESDTITGADAVWQNPGGGYEYGSDPGPLPQGGQAFAFRIEGITVFPAESVPGPSSAFGALAALNWSHRLRRRIRATRMARATEPQFTNSLH
jgi:hypothetical protein